MTEFFESSYRQPKPVLPQAFAEYVIDRTQGNANSFQKRKDETKAVDDFLSLNDKPAVIAKPEVRTPIEPAEAKVDTTKPDVTATPLVTRRLTQNIADGFIVPKTSEMTNASMYQYLSDNFDIFDKNHNGRIEQHEIRIDGKFQNKDVENYNKFAHRNYYALRDLSNDDDGREQGISRQDLSILMSGTRPDRAAADLGTSLTDAVLDNLGPAVGGFIFGVIKGARTGNWKAALTIGALGAAGSVGKGSIDLVKQSWQMESLDPDSMWYKR